MTSCPKLKGHAPDVALSFGRKRARCRSCGSMAGVPAAQQRAQTQRHHDGHNHTKDDQADQGLLDRPTPRPPIAPLGAEQCLKEQGVVISHGASGERFGAQPHAPGKSTQVESPTCMGSAPGKSQGSTDTQAGQACPAGPTKQRRSRRRGWHRPGKARRATPVSPHPLPTTASAEWRLRREHSERRVCRGARRSRRANSLFRELARAKCHLEYKWI